MLQIIHAVKFKNLLFSSKTTNSDDLSNICKEQIKGNTIK